MPMFNRCSKRHVRYMLSGRKDFFYTNKIKTTEVDVRKELCLRNVYDTMRHNPR